jgi:voltage-gated potassium channel
MSRDADRRQPRSRAATADVRWRVLRRLEEHLDIPMAILAVAWLGLFIVEVTRGLSPVLTGVGTAIWIFFVADFLLRLLLAPDRWAFVRRSWLTVISLIVPALAIGRFARVIRALRIGRTTRGLRLVRAVASFNRGAGALGATMQRRGMWYVIGLVLLVCFAGAAGMYALEPHAPGGGGFASYADALWWTAMIMTTMGSAYWPRTGEGRVLALLISLVAIGVFGYFTAVLASLFVGRDAAGGLSPSRSVAREVSALTAEIAALRRALSPAAAGSGGPEPTDHGPSGAALAEPRNGAG